MSEMPAESNRSGTLAIVPARAGSKGIVRKNLRRVGDNSLIGHACQVAARCPSVQFVVITSDDEEMGQEGLRNGADYFIVRPTHLATDAATSAEAWQHAWLEAEREFSVSFDISVWLQPTSPLRSVHDVEVTIRELRESGASASLTVSPVPKHFAPLKQMALTESGTIVPFVPSATPNLRRQDVPDTYWLNGHCYAVRRDTFLRDGIVIPADARPVIIRRPVVNIDEPQDLKEADRILSDPRVSRERFGRDSDIPDTMMK